MRKAFAILAILAVLPFLAATAAEAQEQMETQAMDPESEMTMDLTQRHHITGQIGYQLFDVTDELDDAGAELNEEITFDGRYEYRLTPNWGIEGFVTYSPAKADIFSDAQETDVDAWYATGGVTYGFLPRSILKPFVFGGVGAAILDVSGGDTESYFAGNFGGGVEVVVHRNWAVRGEVRDFIYSVDNLDPASAAALGLPADFDDTINDLQVSAGVTFSF
jgi:outer membrane beta-barrel protein